MKTDVGSWRVLFDGPTLNKPQVIARRLSELAAREQVRGLNAALPVGAREIYFPERWESNWVVDTEHAQLTRKGDATMSKKKKKSALGPRVMLLWSEREMARFNESVERFLSLVNDLEALLAEPKRRAQQAAATRKARLQDRAIYDEATQLPAVAKLYPSDEGPKLVPGPEEMPHQNPNEQGNNG